MSNATDINNALSMFAGWGPTYSALTAAKKSQIDTWRLSGLRQVYSPPVIGNQKIAHEWSFLKPIVTIDTSAPYSTGTVAVASGVVTLTGGTFPSWAANGDLVVASQTLEVSTRDSSTQVTLVDTSITVSSGASYSLVCPRYSLPSGFAGMVGPLSFRPGESDGVRDLEYVGEYLIRRERSFDDSTNRPRVFSLRPMTLGTYKLILYPVPDAVYGLLGKARINPGDNLVGGDDYFELFLESCLAVAENRSRESAGVHSSKFRELLTAAISLDQSQCVSEYLGVDVDRSDRPRPNYLSDYDNGSLVPYGGYQLLDNR